MSRENGKGTALRVAAIGDVHASPGTKGRWRDMLAPAH